MISSLEREEGIVCIYITTSIIKGKIKQVKKKPLLIIRKNIIRLKNFMFNIISDIITSVVKMNAIFEPGRIVRGKVSGIKDYGIFVTFENGYTGMIHISEISDNYVRDIHKYAQVGEIIPCKILEMDSSIKRVKLTIKNVDYLLRRDGCYNENFEPLKEKLPIWMKEKLNEIEEKS